MARPTINEKLVADEVVELVLPDASNTVIEVSLPGLALQDISLGPPSKNLVDTTGRGYARRYEHDGTEGWSA